MNETLSVAALLPLATDKGEQSTARDTELAVPLRLAAAEGGGVLRDCHINMARAGEESSAAMWNCVATTRTRANELDARERQQGPSAAAGNSPALATGCASA
jgi:hypothetical protein